MRCATVIIWVLLSPCANLVSVHAGVFSDEVGFLAALPDSLDSDCPNGPKSATLTLKKKLFCGYEKTMRPVKDQKNMTNITYNLYPLFFTFDDYMSSLEIHSFVFMEWVDEHLIWNKTEYSGVEKLQVAMTEIWVPDIDIYTPAYIGTTGAIPNILCTVQNDGRVACVAPYVYWAQCDLDIRRWPFDSHNCTMKVGSLSHLTEEISMKLGSNPALGDRINITFTSKGIFMTKLMSDRTWEIVSYQARRFSNDLGRGVMWAWISYSFVLRRHAGFLIAVVIVPAIVFVSGTLSSFCLDPESAERMLLIGVNIIGHCLYMIFFGWHIPENGDNTPLIVTFFRDSFLLVGVSLLITICAGRMNAAARAPPVWISFITDGVLASRPGQFLLLSEADAKSAAGVEGTDDSAENTGAPSPGGKKWRQIATLLDRVSLLVYVITYTILMCAFIPSS